MSRPPNGTYRNASNGSASLPMPSASGMASQSHLATPTQSQQRPASSGMSRAERFEDEKRRIIESCFSKLDANGQLSESYITHIRIHEDAAHPSTPPPPDSAPENKKPRLIIIAVRSTGRVRMHKARENNNGSFSVGKTWNLEELSAIETFSNSAQPPRDDREAQYRQWAGATGFIVTIQKPYYWQAGTSKEKDFFVASAVKIFRKYTKGQVPELRGFDEREQALMLGAAAPEQQGRGSGAPPSLRAPSGSPAPTPPQPPFAAAEQSRDGSRYRGSPGPPGSRVVSDSPARGPNMLPFRPGQQPGGPRAFASTEQMRSVSREPARPDMRPGTSPAPAYPRAPSIGQLPASMQRTSHSQMREDSPSVTPSVSSDRESQNLQVRPRSPLRQRSQQHSVISVPEDGQYQQQQPQYQQPTIEQNGTAPSGPAMFASTRQRWAQQHAQQPPQVEQRQTSAPQLPPLETMRSNQSRSTAPPEDRAPMTAQSDASSAGLDPSDAAAVGAMSSFWGPEPSQAAAPTTPVIQEPSSPPTPERSRRRPPIETRPSEASFDLRPPPLKQISRLSDDRSNYATPEQGATPRIGSTVATPLAGSALATPAREEPPEIKPLTVTGNPDTNLNMPGAFTATPSGPSPTGTPGSELSQEDAKLGESHRPGLGPMIKKRAVADKLKKAAFAASAFKPRAGGAAERILAAKAQREGGEPDGISAVVPRPSASRGDSNVTVSSEAPTSPRQRDFSGTKDKEAAPKVEITSPVSPARQVSRQGLPVDGEQGVQLQDAQQSPQLAVPDLPEEAAKEQELLEERQVRQPQVKVRKRSQQQERYLAELGIDRSLLEGRGLEFETLLTDFGWKENVLQTKQLVDLESDLKRELGRVEAGSWLSHTDAAREERVTQVESLLDKAIAECDELEGLLTLYSVELGSLNEDIAFIEAQSQGLQVQSANQKLLHTELSSLVDTMSLDRSILQPLHYGDLNDPSSLETVELSLVKLYQAMVTIDPSIRSAAGSRKSRPDLETGNELSRMAALREKKDVYERESTQFCQRLLQHLDYAFTTSLNTAKSQAMKAPPGIGGTVRLNKDAFTLAKTGLWMYSPLVLFTKELTPPAWGTILKYYGARAKPLYVDAFKENIAGWKRAARKPTGEEAELLFTHQEKEGLESTSGSGLTSTARKLTVKRSQTLAKSLRNASGEKHSATSLESRNPGALSPSEIFAAAIDEMAPLISQEQNFVVDMFHATSLSSTDFIDAVSTSTPDRRRGTNLIIPKPTEPDREMARRVTVLMDGIFDFFAQEMSVLLEWAISGDPIQGVGVLASLSKHSFYLSGTSQEFLLQLIEQLSAHLQTLWAKFVDEQIRAIEDTKVKIHKRKGVMRFIRVFPHFAAGVENTFAAVARADYEGPSESVIEVRRLVDNAYSSINKAMFDSLKVIAKTSPTAPAAAKTGSVGEDPEDKEMLNYHVLIIENMNHYIEEVDDGGREGVLAEWRGRAMLERMEALEAYVGRVVRRPLGKLMDFLDSIDSLLTSTPNPASISTRPSYSRKTARSLLAAYDSKEIRRGIDTLRKRIEKHFGEADDEAISRNLVAMVGKECERAYEKAVERVEKVIREVYPATEGEKAVEVEFSREDVRAGFRR